MTVSAFSRRVAWFDLLPGSLWLLMEGVDRAPQGGSFCPDLSPHFRVTDQSSEPMRKLHANKKPTEGVNGKRGEERE